MATKITVGDKEFVIDRVSAAQVAGALRIVSRLSLGAKKSLAGMDNVADTDFLWAVLGNISEEDLVTLSALAIGCDKEFAREHFDLEWASNAIGALLRHANIGVVVTNFTSALAQMES